MNKIQMAQLAWSAFKNKVNVDIAMKEMGKSLENTINAMAQVDPETTIKILKDVLNQVEMQAKNYTTKIIEEKGEFVENFLNELPEEENKEQIEDIFSALNDASKIFKINKE